MCGLCLSRLTLRFFTVFVKGILVNRAKKSSWSPFFPLWQNLPLALRRRIGYNGKKHRGLPGGKRKGTPDGMKRLYTLLLTLGLLLALSITASGAGNGVRILLDGVTMEASASAYITEGGVTMVPLRALSEALGFTVSWDQDSRSVSISSGSGPAERVPLSALVALDPGHGGDSTGAAYGGVSEKDLNLAIAQQAAALLEAEGVSVLMTRDADTGVGLYERTALAASRGADLFVSIHCNASLTNDAAKGVYTAAYARDSAGWDLSEHLRRSMLAAADAPDMGGEERPDLVVLHSARMPAALVECGYMSTPEELALLQDPAYQALLAKGIAGGVLAYLAQQG